MQPRLTRGTVWPPNQPPIDAQLSLQPDGTILIRNSTISGRANIFAQYPNNRSYALGEWDVANSKACRPKSVLSNIDDPSREYSAIETSALKRLHTILQLDKTVDLQFLVKDRSTPAKCKPVSPTSTAQIFMVEMDEGTANEGDDISGIATISGMSYAFRTHVLGKDRSEFALSLPTRSTRILRRSTVRGESGLAVRILDPQKTTARIINASPLGLRIELGTSIEISRWEEIVLEIDRPSLTSIQTHALVIDTYEREVHLILCGGEDSQKERFYALSAHTNDNFELREDSEATWSCLSNFGYLGLVKGANLEQVHDSCISAWNETKHSPSFFQPVAFCANEPVGTIAAAQIEPNHWVPHSLSTKVDPNLITISAALYMSWPTYLLGTARPLWMSTWYDSNKPWHNRFYQVFIKEHQPSNEVVTFVRKWFWAPTLLQSASDENITIHELENLTPDEQEQVLCMWGDRYRGLEASPVTNLRASDFGPFKRRTIILKIGNKLQGVCALLTSHLELNPMSMLNCAHYNNFVPNVDPNQFQGSIHALLFHLSKLGLTRAAISLDFDTSLLNPVNLGLMSIGDGRCLSTTSKLLPALISNNSLSFADMAARHNSP